MLKEGTDGVVKLEPVLCSTDTVGIMELELFKKADCEFGVKLLFTVDPEWLNKEIMFVVSEILGLVVGLSPIPILSIHTSVVAGILGQR